MLTWEDSALVEDKGAVPAPGGVQLQTEGAHELCAHTAAPQRLQGEGGGDGQQDVHGEGPQHHRHHQRRVGGLKVIHTGKRTESCLLLSGEIP